MALSRRQLGVVNKRLYALVPIATCMSVVESLPDTPLTQVAIDQLDTAPSTDFCESIVGQQTYDDTTPPTDAVVAFWLATEDDTYLLGYRPDISEWALIDEFEWDETDLEIYLEESTDTLLDWLDSYYDQDDLAFITETDSDDEIEAHLLDILPSTAVPVEEIADLTKIPGVEQTEPLATVADSEDAILFSAALFDTVYVLGFEANAPEELGDESRTSTGDWHTYSTHAIDDTTDPSDADPDITAALETITEYYSEDLVTEYET